MKSTEIVLQIQASYNQFTKAEKKVASYVIENKKKVLYMSITDLADACQVGETSVYRFCRTINLQGYQEFKMKLSISLAAEGSIHKRKEEDGDQGLDNFAEQIMKLHTQAIHESYCLLDTSQFQKILQMMNDAKRIFFFGIGDSLLTAEEARNKFIRITNKVVCISDPHIQAMAAAVASEEDLFVIISYSGATKDNIHVAKEAKQAGAKVASITHFKKSPLTAHSDAYLLCGSEEAPLDGGSMSAKMGQLYLIDLLYQEYYRKNYEECKANNQKTSNSVVEKLY